MNGYQIKRVAEALDHEKWLTAWEWDFINDIADKGDDYELSEKQNEILNRISQKMG